MALYADQMRRTLTGRAGDWLARRRWPHLTMASAFVLSTLAAYQCSGWVVDWGGLALRFSVNFLAGYAVFVLYLALWIATKPSLDRSALLDGAPETIETKNPWDDEEFETTKQLIEQTQESIQNQEQDQGLQGLIGLTVFAVLMGTLFVATHMTWYARWYLGRLLILGGKVRHRTLPDAPAGVSCVTAPLQLTIWAALILLAHYALLGLLLQWAFPQAATVADIVRSLRR